MKFEAALDYRIFYVKRKGEKRREGGDGEQGEERLKRGKVVNM